VGDGVHPPTSRIGDGKVPGAVGLKAAIREQIGALVGRGRGVGVGVANGVGVTDGVGVADGVGLAVGDGDAVGVAVGRVRVKDLNSLGSCRRRWRRPIRCSGSSGLCPWGMLPDVPVVGAAGHTLGSWQMAHWPSWLKPLMRIQWLEVYS
jgi:hypothetical protein